MTAAHIVIPIKHFAAAKQRLAPHLTPEQRARLAEAMCRDVLAAALRVAPVLVVAYAAEVAALARSAGAGVLWEDSAQGHSVAAQRGIHALRGVPNDRVLVIPGDAPLVTAAELAALLDGVSGEHDLLLVPNRENEGTNGIACRVAHAIPFQFGPGSLARHQAAAQRAGLTCQTVRVASLALDIDTADDLALLRRNATLPVHTAVVLSAFELLQGALDPPADG